jgi:hypothetical protein
MSQLVAALFPRSTKLDPQIRRQLCDVIYVAKPGEYDDFGNPSYGEPEPEAARIVYEQKKIVDFSGQEVIASVEILTDAQVELQDYIWLPGCDPDVLTDARAPQNRQLLHDEHGRFVATRVWLGEGSRLATRRG